MKEWICAAFGAVGSVLILALGGWDIGLQVLLAFMGVDLCTGLLTAAVFHRSTKSETGRLDSRRCFQGVCRKAAILLIIGAAHALDVLLGSQMVRNAALLGFCASEAISITENAGLMGIPLPTAWKNAIAVLSQHDSKSKETEDDIENTDSTNA